MNAQPCTFVPLFVWSDRVDWTEHHLTFFPSVELWRVLGIAMPCHVHACKAIVKTPSAMIGWGGSCTKKARRHAYPTDGCPWSRWIQQHWRFCHCCAGGRHRTCRRRAVRLRTCCCVTTSAEQWVHLRTSHHEPTAARPGSFLTRRRGTVAHTASAV